MEEGRSVMQKTVEGKGEGNDRNGEGSSGVGKRLIHRSGLPSSGPLSSGVSFEVITGTLGPREGMG